MNRPATTALIAAALILTPTAAHATRGHDPVTICHKPGTPAEHEITVDRDELDKHLKHGDTVGKCEVVTIPTPVEPTPEPEPEPTDPPVIVDPTPTPTPTPTPEPTEEPTSLPTEPPTEQPSPEPVNPDPKPTVEPQPAPSPTPPSQPTTPDSGISVPDSSTSPAPSTPVSTEASSTSVTSPSRTTTPRPELAETGFNRGLLALAAAMVAAGVLSVMGARQWARKERK